jgi:hypothetical protein
MERTASASTSLMVALYHMRLMLFLPHAIVSENNGVILSQFGHTKTVISSDPMLGILTEMSAS